MREVSASRYRLTAAVRHFRPPGWRLLAFASVAYLFLHALAIKLAGHSAMRVSYIFEIAPLPLVIAVCLWRSRQCTGTSRSRWRLVALAFSFWSAGLIITMLQEAFLIGHDAMSLTGDFVFFIYGVPILVALSLSGHDRGFRPVFMLDALQSCMTAVLAYFVVFNVCPFAHLKPAIITPLFLITTYDSENVFLFLASVLPLLASPEGEEKTFQHILCIFFAVYAVVIGICNHLSIAWNLSTGTGIDVYSNIPFLLFLILMITVPVKEPAQSTPVYGSVALFAKNASPIFFTIAVLAMAAYITTKQPYFGIALISFSLLIYCFRATILQTGYFRMQLALHEANGKLEQLSLLDPLTGVRNRRGLERALVLACERAERTGEPLCLLMLDIDYFKALNDRYGHVYGDECLVRIASELEQNLNRSHDTLARFGGEEFAIVLPRTDLESATRVAEKLRSAVLELFIPNESEIGHFVSLSAGIACYGSVSDKLPQSLIRRADQALYQAKHNGRNRIEVAGDETSEMKQRVALSGYWPESSGEPIA